MNNTGKFLNKNGLLYAPDKDPDDVLDYTINYANFLDSDTISASSWLVPEGMTKVSDNFTNTTATVWLSGGKAGETYLITNRITTAAGRTKDKSFNLYVAEQ